jgi:hypothetical protein
VFPQIARWTLGISHDMNPLLTSPDRLDSGTNRPAIPCATGYELADHEALARTDTLEHGPESR